MLTNRIVRALVGVVFAKAAVATGWYLYQKQVKEGKLNDQEDSGSKDINALDNTTTDSTQTVQVSDEPSVKELKPKRVRQLRVVEKTPNDKTVAAMKEAKDIVKTKKTRSSAKKESAQDSEAEVKKPAVRKTTRAKKVKEETTNEA